MNRRNFIQIALPLSLAGALAAQEAAAKQGRLSGVITGVDKATMTIELHPRNEPNIRRKVMWDDKTKFVMNDKPATADDAKEGLSIVAGGKFDGTTLKATSVKLTQK